MKTLKPEVTRARLVIKIKTVIVNFGSQVVTYGYLRKECMHYCRKLHMSSAVFFEFLERMVRDGELLQSFERGIAHYELPAKLNLPYKKAIDVNQIADFLGEPKTREEIELYKGVAEIKKRKLQKFKFATPEPVVVNGRLKDAFDDLPADQSAGVSQQQKEEEEDYGA